MALDQVTVEYNANIGKLQSDLAGAEAAFRKTDQAATQSAGKITNAFKQPIGVIQKLEDQLKNLQERQQRALTPTTVLAFQKKIDETRSKIQALTGTVKESGQSMVSTFKNIATSVGIAFGVQQVLRFGRELIGLALDAEEVKTAFAALNNPRLLDNLRRAVSGTVDDVTLMQAAIRAENLKIPLEDLATLFEFAERRAGEMGQTTESAINAIVNAIGSRARGSFKELGIDIFTAQDAMKGLNFETAEIADISREVTKVVEGELEKMGVNIDSNSDKVARLNAEWKNLKTTIAEGLVTGIVFISDALDAVNLFNKANMGLMDAADRFEEGTFSWSAKWETAEEIITNSIPSVAELQQKLSDLNRQIIDGKIPQSERNILIAEALKLDEQITIMLGQETEAMKANRLEREKQTELQEKHNAALTNAKKDIVTFLRLLPILAKAQDAVAQSGQTVEDLDAEAAAREKRIDIAIREARAKLQLEQDTADGKIKLLEFERDQELKNVELTESEKLVIIKKYAALIQGVQDDVEQARIDRFLNTVEQIRSAGEILNGIVEGVGDNRLDKELEIIEKQKQAQIAALNNQLDNEKLTAKERSKILKTREGIEEQFAKKVSAIQEEAAKKQLKFAIAAIIVNQGLAASEALKAAAKIAADTGTGPIGFFATLGILMPFILSAFGGILSAVNAVELAEGEVDLKGPGTKKSDSIPARLSKGESVITADGTTLDPDLLRAMNKGESEFLKHIQVNYVWPYMEQVIKAHSKAEAKGLNFTDKNLLKELRTGNKLQIKTTQAMIAAMRKNDNNRGKRA